MTDSPFQRVPVPTIPHHWNECRGITIRDPKTLQEIPGTREPCDSIWAGMNQLDRLNWHKACCLNMMNSSIKATVSFVAAELKKRGIGE